MKNFDIDFNCLCDIEVDKLMLLFVKCNKEEGKKLWVEENLDVIDFYDENDCFMVINKECNVYNKFLKGLEFWECKMFECVIKEDKNYYVFEFLNLGGLVMFILLEFIYEDGMKEEQYIFVEIWCCNYKYV